MSNLLWYCQGVGFEHFFGAKLRESQTRHSIIIISKIMGFKLLKIDIFISVCFAGKKKKKS